MSSRPKHTILCIDDNLDTLDLIEVYLYRDFDVFTAGNGFEGMKKASEVLPSLIITDIMMPGVDGIRLFNDLHNHQPTAAIPVVAMTSFIKKITRKSLLNMGFVGVIPKPVDRAKLMSMLADILDIPLLFDNQQQVTDETTT